MLRISNRLRSLLEEVLPNEPLWDICCDHGLLGLRALQEGRVTEVHFVDQVPAIMERLQHKLVELQMQAQLHIRDARELNDPVRGTVVIAGVGGTRILEILNGLNQRGLLCARRLILSPHKDEADFQKLWPEILGIAWRENRQTTVRESNRERPIWILDQTE